MNHVRQPLFTRNFALLILGQITSLIGNFTLKFALSMYVLELTGSAAVFAGLLAAAMVPTILLTPFGGILADRINRKTIMVTLDTLSGIAVLLSAILLNFGDDIPIIGGLLIALSILGAFESPTVQACVPQMLSGDNLLRGNTVVNQVAAIAALVTPFLGSLFYTAWGIRPILWAAVFCFFLTAFFECLIQIEPPKKDAQTGIAAIVKEDFRLSMRFLFREQTNILKLLLFSAIINFFVSGILLVGFPFLVRTVLGLSAEHYGAAESAMGIAAILGGLSLSIWAGKIRLSALRWLIVGLGAALLPAGISFLLPLQSFGKFLLLLVCFCVIQAICSVSSIYCISLIQEKTPQHLTGKVMAYVSALSMCAQPLGQLVYGSLFDSFASCVQWVLILSGVLIGVIGLFSPGFFTALDTEPRNS